VELSTDEFGVVNAQGTAAAAGGVDENPPTTSSSSNAPAPGAHPNAPDSFSDSEDEAAHGMSSDQHAEVLKFYSTTSNAASTTSGFSKGQQKKATHKDYSNASRMEHALTRFAWGAESVSKWL
jgi:hypothetical protein